MKYSVAVGKEVVTLKSSSSSSSQVVGLLGADTDDAGRVKTLYLDSLVHRGNKFNGWDATGAISTCLHRCDGINANV